MDNLVLNAAWGTICLKGVILARWCAPVIVFLVRVTKWMSRFVYLVWLGTSWRLGAVCLMSLVGMMIAVWPALMDML